MSRLTAHIHDGVQGRVYVEGGREAGWEGKREGGGQNGCSLEDQHACFDGEVRLLIAIQILFFFKLNCILIKMLSHSCANLV